ncbi:MAG: pantetheine-phosphate adenylyltransferase [Flavobacteriales bacterium]
MKKVAVFPGSFDPITKGHEEIVRRAALLFDEVIVAVGRNTSKAALFAETTRLDWVKKTFADMPQVRVEFFEGLTIDFCKKNNASYIVRGIRNGADFEYERSIAHMNKQMFPGIETVLLYADPQWISLSSTIIREIIKNKGDVSQFLPSVVDVYAS